MIATSLTRAIVHMKFTLDHAVTSISSAAMAAGEVRIGELVQHAPCIVTADQLILDWQARDVQR